MDDGRLPIDAALDRLHRELSARDADKLTIRVSEPEDLPHVAALARLINQYGDEVGRFLDMETKRHQQRSDELMQAYNALQSQQDEMHKELDMARRIQLRLLPQEGELPDRPEIACAGYYDSMSNVGGDLYDIIRIGRNSYGALIADVSGHGVPAALITALVKISFRTKIFWGVSTADVCRRVNEELYPLLSDLDYYVTAYFLIIDLERGELEYTNCGHHPALLLRVREDTPVPLDTKGRFLGAFDDVVYTSVRMPLEAQDLILVYTDGIIESRNLLDEEYGYDRLISCLLDIGIDHPSVLIKAIRRNMEGFCMGADPRDDRSMFAVQFLGTVAQQDGDSGNGAGNVPKETVAAHPDSAGMSTDNAAGPAVAILRQAIPQAMERQEWNSVISLIRALDRLGGAEVSHLATLASLYYRGGRFPQALEAARAGLARLEQDGAVPEAAERRRMFETIIRRTSPSGPSS